MRGSSSAIRERCRRFVRLRRPGVVADPGAQVAEPRVELGRRGMAERKRRLVRVDRLAVGEDPSRGVARIAERRGRLGIAAGLPLVARDARERAGSSRAAPAASSRIASAMRRWSSRRRARLVDSSARSRSAPCVKS